MVMRLIERIAVMGAGPGGIGTAAALTLRGAAVTLYSRSPERLAEIREQGGIELEGDLGEHMVSLRGMTQDPETAIADAELVLVVVPAFAQVSMFERALPFLKPGAIVLLLTGSCGTLEIVPQAIRAGRDLQDELLLAETVTLPQSARFVAPARLRIRIPARLRAAAFPGRRTTELVERIGDTLSLIPKRNVLDPGLHNPNFLIHPAPMLLNYAAVERADGYLSIMNEGMTPGVLRCLDAVDAEKIALCHALGLDAISIDDLYREEGNGPEVYRHQGEPFGMRDRIWARYVTEDVPYGTVMLSSFGDLIGIPTPVCDSINHVLSIADQTDYWQAGRTVARLGLDGMTLPQIQHYLETGTRLL